MQEDEKRLGEQHSKSTLPYLSQHHSKYPCKNSNTQGKKRLTESTSSNLIQVWGNYPQLTC